MKKIRLGGVPEHFNLPLHLAIEQGNFSDKGIEIEWTTFKGGTGQMTKALREDKIDVCILLTEGIIKDIYKDNPSKIISGYVNTPLVWGIHTGYNNPLKHYEEIYNKRYAISRNGSGSHLMSIVDANSKGHQIEDDQFVIINNLDGALESLSSLQTDVFYWEKFTTKPYVDKKILRRIGEFITPWPCFVIAATDKILKDSPNEIIRMLRVIHDECDRFMQDKANIRTVSDRYELEYQDAEKWYHNTEWAIHGWVSNKTIENVKFNLNLTGLIDATQNKVLVWDRS